MTPCLHMRLIPQNLRQLVEPRQYLPIQLLLKVLAQLQLQTLLRIMIQYLHMR